MILLVENGTNIMQENEHGTLLHAACGASANKAIVAYLLGTEGINVNTKSEPDITGEQFTALDIAFRWNNAEVIALLLQHGAESASSLSQSNPELRLV